MWRVKSRELTLHTPCKLETSPHSYFSGMFLFPVLSMSHLIFSAVSSFPNVENGRSEFIFYLTEDIIYLEVSLHNWKRRTSKCQTADYIFLFQGKTQSFFHEISELGETQVSSNCKICVEMFFDNSHLAWAEARQGCVPATPEA